MQLTGKRVLITGAGHGLGREMSLAFARAGAEIVATDLIGDDAQATAAMVHESGGRAHAYALDVCDNQRILEARREMLAETGPPDVLINNAGIAHGGPFLDVSVEQHHATYRVNLLGQVAMAHAFLPVLIGRSEAHLVNISSASGLIALPYATTYASSKWGVLGFSESIREELRLLGHRHIGVTVVCPSYIDTGMAAGVSVPLFSKMLKPQRVAELVVRAVRKRRELVLTPALVKLTPVSRGLLPPSWFRRSCDWLGITNSMSTWHGHNRPE